MKSWLTFTLGIAVPLLFLAACSTSSTHLAAKQTVAFIVESGTGEFLADPVLRAEFDRLSRGKVLLRFVGAADPEVIDAEMMEGPAPSFLGPHGEPVIGGYAIVAVLTDSTGRLVDAWCLQATSALHSAAALESTKVLRFKAGTYRGKYVDFMSVLQIQFPTEEPEPNKPLQGTEGKIPSSSTESEALRP